MVRLNLTIYLLVILVPASIFGQENEENPRRRISVSINAGGTFGNASAIKDVERALVNAGLNETAPGSGFIFPTGPQAHPFSSENPEPAYSFSIFYAIDSKYSVGLIYQSVPEVQSNGYKNPPSGFFGLDTEIFYKKISSIAPMLGYTLFEEKFISGRFLIGPALHLTRARIEYQPFDPPDQIVEEDQAKPGFIGGLTLKIPARSFLSLNMNLRYNYVIGKTKMGPYDLSAQGITTVLEEVEIQNSSFLFLVGLGFSIAN